MYNLGICYEEGRGVTKDVNQAREWYTKAVAQGQPQAQTQLGRLNHAANNWNEIWEYEKFIHDWFSLRPSSHPPDPPPKKQYQVHLNTPLSLSTTVICHQFDLDLRQLKLYYVGQGCDQNQTKALEMVHTFVHVYCLKKCQFTVHVIKLSLGTFVYYV